MQRLSTEMPFFSKVSKREEKEKLSGEQIDEIEEKLQETAKKYPEEKHYNQYVASLKNFLMPFKIEFIFFIFS